MRTKISISEFGKLSKEEQRGYLRDVLSGWYFSLVPLKKSSLGGISAGEGKSEIIIPKKK